MFKNIFFLKKYSIVGFILFTLIFSNGSIGNAGLDPIGFVSPIFQGVIFWKNGEAKIYYNEPHQDVFKKLNIVLKKLDIKIEDSQITKYGYYIKAGNKSKFTIRIVKKEEKITQLKIRVNFWGDKEYAEMIFRKMNLMIKD